MEEINLGLKDYLLFTFLMMSMLAGCGLAIAAFIMEKRRDRSHALEEVEVREPRARALARAGVWLTAGAILLLLFVPGAIPWQDYGRFTRAEILNVVLLGMVGYLWFMVDSLSHQIHHLTDITHHPATPRQASPTESPTFATGEPIQVTPT